MVVGIVAGGVSEEQPATMLAIAMVRNTKVADAILTFIWFTFSSVCGASRSITCASVNQNSRGASTLTRHTAPRSL